MAILSGYKRWKKTVADANSDHIAVAYWTVGEMVELENGSNVEDEFLKKVNIIKVDTLPTDNIKIYPTLYAIPNEKNPNLYILNEYSAEENTWYQYGSSGTSDIVYMTQAEYDEMIKSGEYDEDTYYATPGKEGSGGGTSEVMTGATSENAGKSGLVPAPEAGQQNLYLRGDGTWAKPSGGASISPKPTVNPTIKNDNGMVIITWEDPTDTVIEGSTFSAWAGTKLVMKETGYPTSPDDGILIVDNTERDKYKTEGFVKDGLTNDSIYYFALFPYSTDGFYNYDSGNRLLGEPTELKIVTFADGTDEEISAMIQAHYDNKINISDYWAVGDKRSVSLSPMSATGVGESHRTQTVEFAIADFDHDTLTTAINGHTKAAVTLTQVHCLMDASNEANPTNGSGNTENGHMNSSNTNSGGWTSCARRTWCNNVYYNALPETFRNSIKEVNKLTSAGNQSSTINTTSDKIWLLSEIEIFGSTTFSYSGEGSQYTYYKTASNRYKNPKWTSSSVSSAWWERSPRNSNSTGFCCVYISGDANNYIASGTFGVAPCLCI